MWSSELWNVEFRLCSCEVQTFEMWSSDFGHVTFRVLLYEIQTFDMWSSDLCYVKFRPLTWEVLAFVMWSPDFHMWSSYLCHWKFRLWSCEWHMSRWYGWCEWSTGKNPLCWRWCCSGEVLGLPGASWVCARILRMTEAKLFTPSIMIDIMSDAATIMLLRCLDIF